MPQLTGALAMDMVAAGAFWRSVVNLLVWQCRSYEFWAGTFRFRFSYLAISKPAAFFAFPSNLALDSKATGRDSR
jgi:hypothetical protein